MGAAVASDSDEPMMDINTTPLIDVMLVLLIMFIITIPVQTHAVDVDLPRGDAVVAPDPVRNRLAIGPDGGLFWNGTPLALGDLPAALGTLAALRPEPLLEVHPHPDAPYARVDEVLALTRRANVARMGFVGNEDYARAF